MIASRRDIKSKSTICISLTPHWHFLEHQNRSTLSLLNIRAICFTGRDSSSHTHTGWAESSKPRVNTFSGISLPAAQSRRERPLVCRQEHRGENWCSPCQGMFPGSRWGGGKRSLLSHGTSETLLRSSCLQSGLQPRSRGQMLLWRLQGCWGCQEDHSQVNWLPLLFLLSHSGLIWGNLSYGNRTLAKAPTFPQHSQAVGPRAPWSFNMGGGGSIQKTGISPSCFTADTAIQVLSSTDCPITSSP